MIFLQQHNTEIVIYATVMLMLILIKELFLDPEQKHSFHNISFYFFLFFLDE